MVTWLPPRPWPPSVNWVYRPFRKYARAIAQGPNGHLFPHYQTHDLEWIVGYMVPMAWFESRGNWWAVNQKVYTDPWRQAAGVFQHMPSYWSGLSPNRTSGRVESTIRHLRAAGVNEAWMDDPKVLEPLPAYAREDRTPTGILHPRANIAVAAYLFGLQGPGAWSPSRSVWRPENYRPGVWGWLPDLGWTRVTPGGGWAD